ncbi:MAG: hypothetical protein ALAOOOJD_00394 [bacterium]|nr:hypothetical protein [bacterium]
MFKSLRFTMIAALTLGTIIRAWGQQASVNAEVSWLYHPNRPGVEAYMQGGAFVASTGSVTAMLFNPAGLARMPGRLTAMVETGWASDTEYLRFFHVDLTAGFQPVQFAGIAFRPGKQITLGAFYARPTRYKIEPGLVGITTEDNPEGSGEFVDPLMKREQTSIGLALATAVGEKILLGGGVEWRRSSLRENVLNTTGAGDDDAVRFSAGAIMQVSNWHIGLAAQTKYKASGGVNFTPALPLVNITIPSDQLGNQRPIVVRAEGFRFSAEEPATIRLGLMTPDIFDRLHFSADAEYKSFAKNAPIKRWQFYGGGNVALTPGLHWSFGVFTFTKDYSAFIEGPHSEIFWTTGGTLEISRWRFSASFMDSDLLTKDFVGQQFVSLAVGYVIP